MSLHKLSTGSGYTYLTRQVAPGDVTARGRGSLGAYYEQLGESPGVWLGAGLQSLAGGPRAGDPVSEAQMLALFGCGHHPLASTSTGLADDRDPGGGPAAVRLGAPQEGRPARSPPARSPPSGPDAGRRKRSHLGRGDALGRPLLVTRGDDLPARGGAP
jgi:hypothetical protein